MKNSRLLLHLTVFFLSPLAGSAQAQAPAQAPLPRTALVMGVGDYGQKEAHPADRTFFEGRSLKDLPGITTADLPNMAAKLRALGFAVTVAANPTLGEAKAAVDLFSSRIKANPGVSLFYFSGHGGEARGQNYLIPRRADIASQADLAQEALNAQRVLNGMEESGALVNLVFLDCCRNDLGKSLTGADMAPMQANGSFIGFATRSGEIADPGEQGSPYTRFLLQHMDLPGVSIADMYSNVIRDVKDYTKSRHGSERRPNFISGLDAPFYFVPVLPRPAGPQQPTPGSAPPAPPAAGTVLPPGRTAGERTVVEVAGGVGIPFRWCPPGTFSRGSPPEVEKVLAAAGEKPEVYRSEKAHAVTLTHGFWLAETELTHGQWQGVMGTTVVDQGRKALADNALYQIWGKKQTWRDSAGMRADAAPSSVTADKSDKAPMYLVSWEEAVAYCVQAGRKVRLEGWEMVLPTEAQWEYACRAGATGLIYGGELIIRGDNYALGLDPIAWYGGNSSQEYTGAGWSTVRWKQKQYTGSRAGPHRVATKKPNPWGFYDMIGNLSEWCADGNGPYPVGPVTDPAGAASSNYRIRRGGSWSSMAVDCRAAARSAAEPGLRFNNLGFRPALVPAAGPGG